jgi:prepilin signal peptidase PulO-like enzyme (type II secretory pathway)
MKLEIKNKTAAEIINLAFNSFLVLYLILLLAEQVWPTSVLLYLNLNYLLVFVIILGVISVFTEQAPRKKEPVTKKDYAYITLLGIIGFIIIFIKTRELGWLSYVISIIAGVLIFLLSWLVLEEDEDEKGD